MRFTQYFSIGRDDFVIGEPPALERLPNRHRYVPLGPDQVRGVLGRGLRDPVTRSALLGLYERCIGPVSRGRTGIELQDRLVRACGPLGRLIVMRYERERHGIARAWATVNLEDIDDGPTDAPTHFAQFEVVDQNGAPAAALAGMEYELTLPGQPARRTALTSDAVAYFSPVDPGTVQVQFSPPGSEPESPQTWIELELKGPEGPLSNLTIEVSAPGIPPRTGRSDGNGIVRIAGLGEVEQVQVRVV